MSFLLTPHIAILDTTSQAIATANTPQVITFDTVSIIKKMTALSTSRFNVLEHGDYLLAYTVEVTATNANKKLDIWIRVNGVDVPLTNVQTTVVNNEVRFSSSVNTLVLVPDDYVELWMSGDSNTLSLASLPAGTTPTRPASPSIRMTIDRLP